MKNFWLAGLLAAMLAVVSTLGWRAEQERKKAEAKVQHLESALATKSPVTVVSETGGLNQNQLPIPLEKKNSPARSAVDIAPYLKMIDDLRLKTRDLDRELHESRVETVREQAKATEDSEKADKLAAQLASLREEAEATRRRAEVFEADLKAKAQRLIQAETAEKILQDRLNKSELAGRRVLVVSKEVEDLNRRRELAVNVLQRRYRELTDLYRNVSLNAQTRETSGSGMQAGDLSRIQTALQQAEEELRNLQTLNARVAELARAK